MPDVTSCENAHIRTVLSGKIPFFRFNQLIKSLIVETTYMYVEHKFIFKLRDESCKRRFKGYFGVYLYFMAVR